MGQNKFTVRHFCRAKILEMFVSFCGVELESNDSKYLNPLIIFLQKRCLEKLKINGQVLKGPYHIWPGKRIGVSKDMTKWPELQFGDVYT